MSDLIAHVRRNDSSEHSLIDHLSKVAQLAMRFAGQRGGKYAQAAGLLHDLGKAQAAFQKYIHESSLIERENAHIEAVDGKRPTTTPHSTAGAKYAVKQYDAVVGHILAYVIAGHHAGLADWEDKGHLKKRLQEADGELAEALKGWANSGQPESFFTVPPSDLVADFPKFLSSDFCREVHIWIRFIFSCLVDADFLDTEAFMNGYADADAAKAAGLRPHFPSLETLHQRYNDYMTQLQQQAEDSSLNQKRQHILQQCFQAASLEHNLFSLTVPTGGGKTLASLGFAFKHAVKFGKKRIIYAIPFTSIIEQNADVFRKALGDDAVLEQHSHLEVSEKQDDENAARHCLATENWDAPLIVTTNVQFFESLFASRTSRCRKIHHIADSVVILDEAQQIPREFQKPITDMMRVLAKDYGVTFVLCTATQPELGRDIDVFGRTLLEGLPNIHEIIEDKEALAQSLRRVHIRLPEKTGAKRSWQEIANEIATHPCVLAVVNTRRHAQQLFDALPNNGIKLHLSANMCARHRMESIALIRRYLQYYQQGKLNQPFWVVSTQLIEAGVDLDFPIVYRAMAGLDSINAATAAMPSSCGK